jgi:hypothetical protein
VLRTILSGIVLVTGLTASSSALAAQNNGGGPVTKNIGELQSQGYVCIKTDNFSTLCMKGGSIYICPDSITCIETAKKQVDTGTLRAPTNGLKKSVP